MVGIGKYFAVKANSEDLSSIWYTSNNFSNLLLSNVFITKTSEGNEVKFEN